MVSTVPPRKTTGRPGCGASELGWVMGASGRRRTGTDRRPHSGGDEMAVTLERPFAPVKSAIAAVGTRSPSAVDSGGAADQGSVGGTDDCPSPPDVEGWCAGMATDGTPGSTPRSGPLAGLMVADFSRILAGPYATMLLADLGADVVKVEGPRGDDTRTWQPPVRDGVATYYLGVNRNKRSIALDLADPDDCTAARELARRADVLVENFRPGGLARFGLDYETGAGDNPRVVYASISGFGSGPEGAKLRGYDLIVQAISGLMSLTGSPDGEPYRAGISVFDVMAGLHATIGVLSALNLR